MLASESDTAFAIDGEGFFAVRGADGNTYYTRNGNFTWSIGNDGVILTNSDGYPVLDSRGNMIRKPDGVAAEKVSVTSQDSSITEMHRKSGGYEPEYRIVPVQQSGRT